jgi:hypothetical protein
LCAESIARPQERAPEIGAVTQPYRRAPRFIPALVPYRKAAGKADSSPGDDNDAGEYGQRRNQHPQEGRIVHFEPVAPDIDAMKCASPSRTVSIPNALPWMESTLDSGANQVTALREFDDLSGVRC